MLDALMYLAIAVAAVAVVVVAAKFAGFNQLPPVESESRDRIQERSESGDIAHGAAMGNPFDISFVILASLFRSPPRVPWWRRWRFRLLALAAIGTGLIISGSKLL